MTNQTPLASLTLHAYSVFITFHAHVLHATLLKVIFNLIVLLYDTSLYIVMILQLGSDITIVQIRFSS